MTIGGVVYHAMLFPQHTWTFVAVVASMSRVALRIPVCHPTFLPQRTLTFVANYRSEILNVWFQDFRPSILGFRL